MRDRNQSVLSEVLPPDERVIEAVVARYQRVETIGFDYGQRHAVELTWRTGSELNNLGFNLYRSTSAHGPFELITGRLVPGLGSSPAGATYEYRDEGLVNDTTYFYELEDVETTGATERHGPAFAAPHPLRSEGRRTRTPRGPRAGRRSLERPFRIGTLGTTRPRYGGRCLSVQHAR